MKKPILILMLFVSVAISAQQGVFVTNNASLELNVINGANFYSRGDITNEGTIRVIENSVFEFDADLFNQPTGNLVFQTNTPTNPDIAIPANPGIFKIGSGTSNSSDPQSLNFKVVGGIPQDEFIPIIQLDKLDDPVATDDVATIVSGHVRLTQSLIVDQGILDAASDITSNPTIDGSSTVRIPNVTNLHNTTGLTFASDANTTAIVDESNFGFVNNVIVERFIPQSNRAFRMYSSSVDLTGTISQSLQEGGQIDNWTGPSNGLISDPIPGYGTHITGVTILPSFPNFQSLPDAINTGLDITNTGNTGLFTWDSSTQSFVPVTSTVSTLESEDMDADIAYFFFIRGDRSLDLSVNNVQVGQQTRLRTRGNLRIGTVAIPSTVNNAGDFIMLPNPYQAQVNLLDVLGDNTSVNNNLITVFDPTLGVNGTYVTVDLSDPSNVSNTVSGSISGTSDANQFLQPNQSYFATTNVSGTVTVTYEEADKRDANVNATVGIFSEDTDTKFNVTLFNKDTNYYNDNVLLKYGNYNDAIDEYDGLKYWNMLENVAVQHEDAFTMLDKRNINGDLDNILLNITGYTDVNYQLQTNFINSNGFENAYLIDHYLETQTELVEGVNLYDFTIDSGIAESFDPNRFEIGINVTTLSTDNPEAAATGLNLYPNPATTSVNLSLSGSLDSIKDIQIISMEGKLVKKLSIDNLTSYDMDVSDLSTGVYIINATTQENTFTNKLIIE